MSCGGCSSTKPATDEIKQMVCALQEPIKRKAEDAGYQGAFTELKSCHFATRCLFFASSLNQPSINFKEFSIISLTVTRFQLVDGINYFVKVYIGGSYIHVCIYRPFGPQRACEITAVQTGKSARDPIDYF